MQHFVMQSLPQLPIWMWVVVGLLAIFALGSAAAASNKGKAGAGKKSLVGPSPFRVTSSMLSAGERLFYDAILHSIDAHKIVLLKVRMLDLFESLPPDMPNRKAHQNRVMSKHVDYVVCDRTTLRPLLVIELDDRTHDRADRKTRDAVVDEILAAAGLPILHCRQRREYAVAELAAEIRSASAPTPRSRSAR